MHKIIAIVFAALFLVASVHGAPLGTYKVNPKLVSVSGLSSGAFFAVQYHVAFSSELIGAAIFAGGPYYCAQNSITTATVSCMYIPSNDVAPLISFTSTAVKEGKIDNTDNLEGQNVFIYSGNKDTVVNPGVVKMAQAYYNNYSANVQTMYDVPSQHCMPTNYFGNSCSFLGSPYINNCDFDGAGTALKHIYGDYITNQSTTANSANILSFDQSKFGSSADCIGSTGYLYVPTACQNGAECALHVVFHGCSQTTADIGDDYYTNTGYNGWAEANNIIVLYPQVTKKMLVNPSGCWDWWGYTGSDYAFQSGAQMRAVKAMIDTIMGIKKQSDELRI